jgi:hypothetical protein
MSKRGKVLRDPSNGPGLLIVDGQQHPFFLEGTWKSLTLPKPGLDVDVEFNPEGSVSSVTAVAESQLAKEQAERTLNAAKEKGSALAATAVAKFGTPTLAASGVLVLGWFFLNALTYDAGFVGRLNFTFWRVLGFLNSPGGLEGLANVRDGGSAGIYGLLALAALAGPFVSAFWKDKRAMLGAVLPLVFMILVAILVRSAITSTTRGMPSEIADAARAELTSGISLGLGAYLSVLAALYLGFNGVKKFLAARAAGN